jgi:hypothetical protein
VDRMRDERGRYNEQFYLVSSLFSSYLVLLGCYGDGLRSNDLHKRPESNPKYDGPALPSPNLPCFARDSLEQTKNSPGVCLERSGPDTGPRRQTSS